MDIINRDKVLSHIKNTHRWTEYDRYSGEEYEVCLYEDAELAVRKVEQAFCGMTNGEVIRAIFPNVEWQTLGKETQYEWAYTPDTYVADLDGTKTFIPAEIWNASYRKGGTK